MLQQAQHAVCVEYMPTSELDTSLFAQVACVTDSADLVAMAATGWILAGEAVMLLLHSVASVTTFVNSCASSDFGNLYPFLWFGMVLVRFHFFVILLNLFALSRCSFRNGCSWLIC